MKKIYVSRLYKVGRLFIILGALLLTASVVVAKDKDAALEISDNFSTWDLTCTAVTGGTHTCTSRENPDDTGEKAVHTVTLSAVVTGGDVNCLAKALIINLYEGGGGSSQSLVQVFASPGVPAALSLALARPIVLEDRDEIEVLGVMPGSSNSADKCRVTAVFGIEELTN